MSPLSRILIATFAPSVLTSITASYAVEIPKPVINISKPNIPKPNIPKPNIPKPTINVPRPATTVPQPHGNLAHRAVDQAAITVPQPHGSATHRAVDPSKPEIKKPNLVASKLGNRSSPIIPTHQKNELAVTSKANNPATQQASPPQPPPPGSTPPGVTNGATYPLGNGGAETFTYLGGGKWNVTDSGTGITANVTFSQQGGSWNATITYPNGAVIVSQWASPSPGSFNMGLPPPPTTPSTTQAPATPGSTSPTQATLTGPQSVMGFNPPMAGLPPPNLLGSSPTDLIGPLPNTPPGPQLQSCSSGLCGQMAAPQQQGPIDLLAPPPGQYSLEDTLTDAQKQALMDALTDKFKDMIEDKALETLTGGALEAYKKSIQTQGAEVGGAVATTMFGPEAAPAGAVVGYWGAGQAFDKALGKVMGSITSSGNGITKVAIPQAAPNSGSANLGK
jgi:hypothetical protein